MAKHSVRDYCSIVLFIPYYVLLTSICYASMSPGLPTTHPPMGQTHRRWSTTLARRASTDGRPVGRSTDGSDPSVDGSDRLMARNINTALNHHSLTHSFI